MFDQLNSMVKAAYLALKAHGSQAGCHFVSAVPAHCMLMIVQHVQCSPWLLKAQGCMPPHFGSQLAVTAQAPCRCRVAQPNSKKFAAQGLSQAIIRTRLLSKA